MRLLILITAFIFIFNGCGGGGGTSTSSDTTSGGYTVVDPYIKNATFFWDKDSDGVKDSDEPLSSLSDENGNFSFEVSIPEGSKIVMYDKGEHNGISYTGQLEAVISSSKVISPLTTLSSMYENVDIASILENAGAVITASDLDQDPMKSNNHHHIVASIAVDFYLKLNNLTNIDTTEVKLSDTIKLVQYLILQDISAENIQNSVSIIDYLTQKIKQDGNLDELTLLLSDNTYRQTAKNLLINRTDKTKPGMLKFIRDELIGSESKLDSKFLDNVVDSFDKYPVKGETTTLSLDIESFPLNSEINWTVASEPASSSLTLSVSSDKRSISFTPSAAGDYTIHLTVEETNTTSSKDFSFTVEEIYFINMDKVDGVTADTNLSEHVGIVTNQSWIASNTLTEQELTDIAEEKSALVKLGYDKTSGLLVEYDESTSTALEQIEELKYEQGVSNVYNRVYIGEDAYKPFVVHPDDNGGFNDGGANWHHEAINTPEAWDYTTGSDDFLIGICDSGYDNKHSDMQGRFAKFLSSSAHSHGMGVAGSIAANSDNGIGISGINWTTDVVACVPRYVSDIENTVDTTVSGKETKLLTNSWGLGYLPQDFNPYSSAAAQMFIDKQNAWAPIRQVVASRTDKLFLWAAGNGVGNGASTSGYYGVDAKYENGAMQYSNSVLNKLDNLLIVAAFVMEDDEKVLRYYSDFGTSVDIASPTEFDSLNLNNTMYSSFGGTSAATPVVSAVASLIISINPDLTPAEVKDILISSATETIIKRQTKPDYYNAGLDTLSHEIPVLNAKEAVKMAYETVHGSEEDGEAEDEEQNDLTVNYVAQISDHITPKATLRYFSYDKDYKVVAISSTLKSSTTQGAYSSFTTGSSSSDSIEITLDSSKRYHQITSVLTLQHLFTQETKTTTSVKEFTYSDLTIRTIDFSNGQIVPNADFNVTYSTIYEDHAFSGTTDSAGEEKVYLPYGFFKLTGQKEGYRDAKQIQSTTEAKSYFVDLPFGSILNGEAGAISGVVLDENGDYVEGAIVTIYDNTKTLQTTITDSSGNYYLWNVQKRDTTDALITNFKMTAEKTGYSTAMKQQVIVLDGVNRTENFTIIEEPDNQLPVAVAGDDQNVVTGDMVVISSSGSYDPDGYIKEYEWLDDFENSVTTLDDGPFVITSKLDIGVHKITLTVTDNDGASSSNQVTITVIGEPVYDWVISDWGDCEGECDTSGTQTRTVVCKDQSGNSADDSSCEGTKPDISQSCSTEKCPFEYDVIVSSETGRTWLDRNLGAKQACTKSRNDFSSDSEYVTSQEDCFGDYYQWGRETDGHEELNSDLTTVVVNSIEVDHDKFIIGSSNYDYDWTTADETGSSRVSDWSKISGLSICPSGFRVPTIEEIQAENIANRDEAFTNLKLPASGLRSGTADGVYSYKGSYGVIWSNSSDLINDNYYTMYFKYSEIDFAYGSGKRVTGFPIRCIKPDEQETNNAPIADAGSDQTAKYGTNVVLDGSNSSDNDGTIENYVWKENDTLLSTQSSFTTSGFSEGLHQILLTVTDDDNATDTDMVLVNITSNEDVTYDWATSSWSICTGVCGTNNGIQSRTVVCKSSVGNTVSDNLCTDAKPDITQSCTASTCEVGNQRPVANAGPNRDIYFGDSVTLDGSDSYDSDGSISSYIWKSGVNIVGAVDTVTLSDLALGSHIIQLTVTDNEGSTDSDIAIVNVYSEPTYNWATGSWSSCTGDCGVGNGTKTRTVTCIDNSGTTVSDSNCEIEKPSTSSSCTASECVVVNELPVANAGENSTVLFGAAVTLDGSNSIDSDGYLVSYSWSKDSTVFSTSKTFTLAELSVGTHTIILTVTDNSGDSDSDQVIITVEAQAADSYYWSIESWGDCEGECGINNGTQERTVVCKDTDDDSVVSDSFCSGIDKPDTTQSCTASDCIPEDVEDNETIVSPVTGRTWMDRNLGASRACITMFDSQCFGNYYQWGRDSDGHELTTSLNSNTVITSLDNTHSDFVISSEYDDYDWITIDNDGDIRESKWSLTDASAVCPNGFRLPTHNEWVAETIESAADGFNNLKLPLSGERSYLDGNTYGQNNYGGVWSSSADGFNSMFLYYSSDYVEWIYHSRASGRAVRCIKDE
ncbi:MAG: thrombospondin type-1 domain-containing protein [Campylobacterota bacterium]|nr:thrombospondin type-1 domain-containing protein [Campylobacterota bacterium]